jgi:hypothetical protein
MLSYAEPFQMCTSAVHGCSSFRYHPLEDGEASTEERYSSSDDQCKTTNSADDPPSNLARMIRTRRMNSCRRRNRRWCWRQPRVPERTN